jgi:hypothetical protein
VAGPRGVDQDACAVSVLQRFERRLRIRINGRDVGRWPGLGDAGGQAFNLPDAHAAAGDAAGQFEAFLGIGDREKRPAVAGREAAFFDQVLDHGFELQEAQRIGDGGAILSGALGDVLLSEIELVGEALEGARLFHGVQIFALEIFDEGHLKREFLRDLANNDGNARQRGPLRSTPAALAGDQLVSKADSTDDERLNDPTRPDRASKLLEGLLTKARSRLIGTRVDEIDIDLLENVIRGLARARG